MTFGIFRGFCRTSLGGRHLCRAAVPRRTAWKSNCLCRKTAPNRCLLRIRERRISPPRVRDVPLPPHPADGADAGGSLLGRTHYVPPHTAGEEKNGTPELSYDADGVLLHRVEVYVWRSDYRYFDQFVQDAAAYAARPAPAEQPAREPFFSFFPQYVQMGRRQETWYLWWREQVRHGVFPDTDYAYILLYVFELINQPLPPVAEDRGEAGTVCRTWRASGWRTRHRYPSWITICASGCAISA